MLPILVLLLLAQASGNPAGPLDAANATLSAAATVAEIDVGKLKGQPVGLAWSGDGAQFYLRMAEYDRFGNETARHYVLPSAGGPPVPADGAPAWAASYWVWKSGLVAPGAPDLRLETEVQQKMTTAVGSVGDGGLSQSRADPSRPQVATDMSSAQRMTTITVRMKGQLLMQLDNESFLPGMRYGWAPTGRAALAYSDGKKRLVLIDRSGLKLEVPGTSDVLLPAWSPDGTRIAYLQKKDKKKFLLNVLTVGAK